MDLKSNTNSTHYGRLLLNQTLTGMNFQADNMVAQIALSLVPSSGNRAN